MPLSKSPPRLPPHALPLASQLLTPLCRTAAAEQDAHYATLSGDKKRVIDNAMVYAAEGKYLEAISTFASNYEKIGFSRNPLIVTILQSYKASPEYFREGLIGFFAKL